MTTRATGGLVDTIVAAATPAGPGERAIVRLSGPDAVACVCAVLAEARLPGPGRVGTGVFALGGGASLPLELLAWQAPRSSTGENVVELHLPGWPPVVAELQRRLIAAGARPAARGEFTRRALVNGRLDLAQALAVGRLAAATELDDLMAAAAVLTGEASRVGGALREALLDVLALLEAHVDFDEEDTEGIDPRQLKDGLARVLALATRAARLGERMPVDDGETDVVLLGAPNAGKSSLMLALVPGAVTSVSPLPGTTRDALEARVERDGRRWRVLDGPGVDTPEGALDELDRQAMEQFLDGLPAAALVLHVHDAGRGPDDPGRSRRLAAIGERPVIDVATKLDRVAGWVGPSDSLGVSALTGQGLETLWRAMSAAAPTPSMPAVATAGEWEAARALPALLAPALSGDLDAELPLLSLGLREALARLDQEVEHPLDVTSEVLDRVFARFCIGK